MSISGDLGGRGDGGYAYSDDGIQHEAEQEEEDLFRKGGNAIRRDDEEAASGIPKPSPRPYQKGVDGSTEIADHIIAARQQNPASDRVVQRLAQENLGKPLGQANASIGRGVSVSEEDWEERRMLGDMPEKNEQGDQPKGVGKRESVSEAPIPKEFDGLVEYMEEHDNLEAELVKLDDESQQKPPLGEDPILQPPLEHMELVEVDLENISLSREEEVPKEHEVEENAKAGVGESARPKGPEKMKLGIGGKIKQAKVYLASRIFSAAPGRESGASSRLKVLSGRISDAALPLMKLEKGVTKLATGDDPLAVVAEGQKLLAKLIKEGDQVKQELGRIGAEHWGDLTSEQQLGLAKMDPDKFLVKLTTLQKLQFAHKFPKEEASQKLASDVNEWEATRDDYFEELTDEEQTALRGKYNWDRLSLPEQLNLLKEFPENEVLKRELSSSAEPAVSSKLSYGQKRFQERFTELQGRLTRLDQTEIPNGIKQIDMALEAAGKNRATLKGELAGIRQADLGGLADKVEGFLKEARIAAKAGQPAVATQKLIAARNAYLTLSGALVDFQGKAKSDKEKQLVDRARAVLVKPLQETFSKMTVPPEMESLSDELLSDLAELSHNEVLVAESLGADKDLAFFHITKTDRQSILAFEQAETETDVRKLFDKLGAGGVARLQEKMMMSAMATMDPKLVEERLGKLAMLKERVGLLPDTDKDRVASEKLLKKSGHTESYGQYRAIAEASHALSESRAIHEASKLSYFPRLGRQISDDWLGGKGRTLDPIKGPYMYAQRRMELDRLNTNLAAMRSTVPKDKEVGTPGHAIFSPDQYLAAQHLGREMAPTLKAKSAEVLYSTKPGTPQAFPDFTNVNLTAGFSGNSKIAGHPASYVVRHLAAKALITNDAAAQGKLLEAMIKAGPEVPRDPVLGPIYREVMDRHPQMWADRASKNIGQITPDELSKFKQNYADSFQKLAQQAIRGGNLTDAGTLKMAYETLLKKAGNSVAGQFLKEEPLKHTMDKLGDMVAIGKLLGIKIEVEAEQKEEVEEEPKEKIEEEPKGKIEEERKVKAEEKPKVQGEAGPIPSLQELMRISNAVKVKNDPELMRAFDEAERARDWDAMAKIAKELRITIEAEPKGKVEVQQKEQVDADGVVSLPKKEITEVEKKTELERMFKKAIGHPKLEAALLAANEWTEIVAIGKKLGITVGVKDEGEVEADLEKAVEIEPKKDVEVREKTIEELMPSLQELIREAPPALRSRVMKDPILRAALDTANGFNPKEDDLQKYLSKGMTSKELASAAAALSTKGKKPAIGMAEYSMNIPLSVPTKDLAEAFAESFKKMPNITKEDKQARALVLAALQTQRPDVWHEISGDNEFNQVKELTKDLGTSKMTPEKLKKAQDALVEFSRNYEGYKDFVDKGALQGYADLVSSYSGQLFTLEKGSPADDIYKLVNAGGRVSLKEAVGNNEKSALELRGMLRAKIYIHGQTAPPGYPITQGLAADLRALHRLNSAMKENEIEEESGDLGDVLFNESFAELPALFEGLEKAKTVSEKTEFLNGITEFLNDAEENDEVLPPFAEAAYAHAWTQATRTLWRPEQAAAPQIAPYSRGQEMILEAANADEWAVTAGGAGTPHYDHDEDNLPAKSLQTVIAQVRANPSYWTKLQDITGVPQSHIGEAGGVVNYMRQHFDRSMAKDMDTDEALDEAQGLLTALQQYKQLALTNGEVAFSNSKSSDKAVQLEEEMAVADELELDLVKRIGVAATAQAKGEATIPMSEQAQQRAIFKKLRSIGRYDQLTPAEQKALPEVLANMSDALKKEIIKATDKLDEGQFTKLLKDWLFVNANRGLIMGKAGDSREQLKGLKSENENFIRTLSAKGDGENGEIVRRSITREQQFQAAVAIWIPIRQKLAPEVNAVAKNFPPIMHVDDLEKFGSQHRSGKIKITPEEVESLRRCVTDLEVTASGGFAYEQEKAILGTMITEASKDLKRATESLVKGSEPVRPRGMPQAPAAKPAAKPDKAEKFNDRNPLLVDPTVKPVAKSTVKSAAEPDKYENFDDENLLVADEGNEDSVVKPSISEVEEPKLEAAEAVAFRDDLNGISGKKLVIPERRVMSLVSAMKAVSKNPALLKDLQEACKAEKSPIAKEGGIVGYLKQNSGREKEIQEALQEYLKVKGAFGKDEFEAANALLEKLTEQNRVKAEAAPLSVAEPPKKAEPQRKSEIEMNNLVSEGEVKVEAEIDIPMPKLEEDIDVGSFSATYKGGGKYQGPLNPEQRVLFDALLKGEKPKPADLRPLMEAGDEGLEPGVAYENILLRMADALRTQIKEEATKEGPVDKERLSSLIEDLSFVNAHYVDSNGERHAKELGGLKEARLTAAGRIGSKNYDITDEISKVTPETGTAVRELLKVVEWRQKASKALLPMIQKLQPGGARTPPAKQLPIMHPGSLAKDYRQPHSGTITHAEIGRLNEFAEELRMEMSSMGLGENEELNLLLATANLTLAKATPLSLDERRILNEGFPKGFTPKALEALIVKVGANCLLSDDGVRDAIKLRALLGKDPEFEIPENSEIASLCKNIFAPELQKEEKAALEAIAKRGGMPTRQELRHLASAISKIVPQARTKVDGEHGPFFETRDLSPIRKDYVLLRNALGNNREAIAKQLGTWPVQEFLTKGTIEELNWKYLPGIKNDNSDRYLNAFSDAQKAVFVFKAPVTADINLGKKIETLKEDAGAWEHIMGPEEGFAHFREEVDKQMGVPKAITSEADAIRLGELVENRYNPIGITPDEYYKLAKDAISYLEQGSAGKVKLQKFVDQMEHGEAMDKLIEEEGKAQSEGLQSIGKRVQDAVIKGEGISNRLDIAERNLIRQEKELEKLAPTKKNEIGQKLQRMRSAYEEMSRQIASAQGGESEKQQATFAAQRNYKAIQEGLAKELVELFDPKNEVEVLDIQKNFHTTLEAVKEAEESLAKVRSTMSKDFPALEKRSHALLEKDEALASRFRTRVDQGIGIPKEVTEPLGAAKVLTLVRLGYMPLGMSRDAFKDLIADAANQSEGPQRKELTEAHKQMTRVENDDLQVLE